jgi:adenine-specific DNA-methyltransferase
MPTLDWIGKKAVVNHHREVPYRLVHCDGELSAGDADAGNLLVKGDNLEALKALLPYYAGKVKCIYIDPPYNTGNENWSYNDNVNSPEIRAWLGKEVMKEEEDLSRHDKWLCMMYPRLRLLREFLREDGLILISHDDNEAQSLRSILDEILGRRCFVANFVWNTDGHTDNQYAIKVNHEYVACYAKNPVDTEFGYVIDPNTREESNVWAGFAENSITKNGAANPASEVTLPIGFPVQSADMSIEASEIPDGLIDAMAEGISSNPLKRRFPGTSFPLRFDKIVAKDGALTSSCRVYSGWANVRKLKAFIDNGCSQIEEADGSIMTFYLSSGGVIYYRKEKPNTTRNILSVLRGFSTTEKMRSEVEDMGLSFTYPKPKQLISYLIQVATGPNDLILDSFAGSGTTGHATLELNKHDGGNRRFILIEMDETTAPDITAKRLSRVINGYDKGGDPEKPVDGLGGGFRYCHLGVPLFNEFGDIDGGVTFPDLAAHVFFAECGAPIPAKAIGTSPYLGHYQDKAVYLLFSAAEAGFAREASGNVLTPDTLATLPAPPDGFGGEWIVYGEGCTVGKERLAEARVTFKQIPYQIEGT